LQEALLIYMQHSIQEREWVIVNAGSRNLVARLQTRDLVRLLQPRVVDVAKD
jgi:prolyl-tRNA editing enzyme YbaK/EbsC (Cys-tRNA(Pro) deacylase)